MFSSPTATNIIAYGEASKTSKNPTNIAKDFPTLKVSNAACDCRSLSAGDFNF